MENVVFGKQWFERHQSKLLWLLNNKITKRWFRWVLRIRSYDCPIDTRINAIAPNNFTYNAKREGDRIVLTTDFRTNEKFGRRLYYAFKPFWYLIHGWDLLFDRIPALDFGFSTLTVYPNPHTESTSVDGVVQQTFFASGDTWANIRGGAGNAHDDVNGIYPQDYVRINCHATTNKFSNLVRSIFLFDTSALTSGVTISAATMSFYGSDKSDLISSTPTLNIYTSTPASNTDLVNSDYANLGTTAQATAISYASYSTTGYNDFTMNATGLGNISKTEVSKFGLREATCDAPNSTPTWTGGLWEKFEGYYAEATGTTSDPKLVVTYTAAATFIPQIIMM